MPTSTLSATATALMEFFDSNNMPNCSILAEVLEGHPEVIAIACMRYAFTAEAIKCFQSEAHYWLTQGLFSQSVIFGYPGHESPLKTLEGCIVSKPISENKVFWDNIEQEVAPKMFSHIGKGHAINYDIGIVVLREKK